MLPPGTPPIGRTRVGLHKSSVIVGNFGGEGRIQYTAFGDAMSMSGNAHGGKRKQRDARTGAAQRALPGLPGQPSCLDRAKLDHRPLGTHRFSALSLALWQSAAKHTCVS